MTIALAATASLALAACGGGDSGSSGNAAGGNESAGRESANGAAPASASGSAAAPGAGDVKISPGLYETTVELSIAGLPDSIAKAMRAEKKTSKSCVTPEEAAKGSGDLFAGKDQGCQSKDVVFRGGRIQGTLTCPAGAGGGTSTISLDGSYSSTSFDVRSHMSTRTQGQDMKVDTRIVGRRIGECTGAEGE
jgi:hypothetical protein